MALRKRGRCEAYNNETKQKNNNNSKKKKKKTNIIKHVVVVDQSFNETSGRANEQWYVWKRVKI
jgi:hypothetical protein